MNSCRTLTSQSLDGPVAGVSSRPWLRDTLWMYRADRRRWCGCIPKKRQSESKNGRAVDGWPPNSFQVPKSECVQARLGSKFCHAWLLGRNTASEASSVQALQQSLHFPSERRSCFHARRMQIHGEVLSHHLSYRSLEKAMELGWKTPETAKKSLHGFSDVSYNLQRMRWELCSRVKYVCTETMLRSIQPDTRASHLKPFTRLKTDAATAVVLPGEIQ